MTYDNYRAARTFRRVMEQPTETNNRETLELQANLISEEYEEFIEAHNWVLTYPKSGASKINALKELADLAYVCYQYAAARGWDLDEALDRVHRSNLSKLVDGAPVKNEHGKVQKGPNYQKPFLHDLIND